MVETIIEGSLNANVSSFAIDEIENVNCSILPAYARSVLIYVYPRTPTVSPNRGTCTRMGPSIARLRDVGSLVFHDSLVLLNN